MMKTVNQARKSEINLRTALVLASIVSTLWLSQAYGELSDPIKPVPWVGESTGISRLDDSGILANRYQLPEKSGADHIDCASLIEWTSKMTSLKGDEVQYDGLAWRANKETRKKPKRTDSGPVDSKKPWQYLGNCALPGSIDTSRVIGLLDKSNILWAYQSDHQLFRIDTELDVITALELPDPVLPDSGECKYLPDWDPKTKFSKGDRVRHLGQIWILKHRSQSEPGKDEHNAPWLSLGECVQSYMESYDCAFVDSWRDKEKYQKNDIVRHLNQAWSATDKTKKEPALYTKKSHDEEWEYLGSCRGDVNYAGHVVTHAGVLWIARGLQLIRLDNVATSDWMLDAPVDAIAWDEVSQQLWVAVGASLQRRDSTGNLIEQIVVPVAQVSAMGIEVVGGLLWISGNQGELLQYDANGVFSGAVSVPLETIITVIAAPNGGILVADSSAILNLDAAGAVIDTIGPVPGSSDILDITITGDNSLWIATVDQLWRYDENNGLMSEWMASEANPGVIQVLSHQVTRNQMPEITSDPETSAILDQEYVDSVSATDPDGDEIGYQLIEAPTGMGIDAVTGSINWLPDQIGTSDVTVEVFDYRGGFDRQSFEIDVSEPDSTAPVIKIDHPTAGSIVEDIEQWVSGSVSEPAVVTVNGQTAQVGSDNSFVFGPLLLGEGLNSIPIVATDPAGNSSSMLVTVTYRPNTPPEINSLPITRAIAGEAYGYQVTAIDAENDPLEYTLIQAPGGMLIGASSGVIQWLPQSPGNFSVIVQANDGRNPPAVQSYTLSVAEPNNLPLFITTHLPDAASEIDYSQKLLASDLDGDAILFSLSAGPSGLVIDPEGFLSWTPPTAGDFIVVVRVSDSRGGITDKQFSIHVVQSNRVPVISSSPIVSVYIHEFYTYPVIATDQDQDALKYSLVDAPPGMNINSVSGVIEWTPVEPLTHSVIIHVEDPAGASTTQQFDVIASLNPSNAPPFMETLADYTVPVGTTLNLQLTAVDPEGDGLLYEVHPFPLPKGFRFSRGSGLFEISPTLESTGTHSFTLVADDRFNKTSGSLTITVPEIDPSQATSLSGRVLDANSANASGTEQAIVGATISFIGTNSSTVTDTNGYFLLTDIPPAANLFRIDGDTADLAPDGSSYASFIESLSLIRHVDNIEARPFYMPRNEMGSMTPIIAGQDAVVVNSRLNISLEVPADTAMNPDGSPFTGSLSISEVPWDLAPAVMPVFFEPDLLITIQPAGTVFTQPLAITFPNTLGREAGQEFDIMSVNPDTGKFEPVGIGRVSADETKVETVSGGIIAADWHFISTGGISDNKAGDDNDNPQTCPVEISSTTCLQDGRLTQTFALPAYRSLEQNHGLNFIYQSNRAGYTDSLPDPIVLPSIPESFSAVQNRTTYRASRGGGGSGGAANNITYTNFKVAIEGLALSESYTLPPPTISNVPFPVALTHVPLNLYNIPTGLYDVTVTALLFVNGLDATSGSGVSSTEELMIVNESTSGFGAGWMLDGLYRLSVRPGTGNALLISPEGNYKTYIFDQSTEKFSTPDADFSTLVKQLDENYIYTDKYGNVLLFNTRGLQTESRDRNGNTTTYRYNDFDHLLEITDPVGLSTHFDYFAGRIRTITDPAGRSSTFEHDAIGNLTRVTYPDGTVTRYVYHGHFMSQKLDEKGNQTQYRYDENGFNTNAILADGSSRKVISAAQRIGAKSTIPDQDDEAIANSFERIATKTDARNHVTEYEIDKHSRIIKVIDAVGRVTEHERNTDSLAIRTVRPNTSVITRNFDDLGNAISVRESFNGAQTAYSYDNNSLVTNITNPRSNTLSITRDPNGDARIIANALGHALSVDYDTRGLPIRMVTPNNLEIIREYNAEGLLQRQIETPPVGSPGSVRTSSYTYYPTGLVEQVTMPDGRIYQFAYDARNRLIRTEDNLGQVEIRQYDEYGNLTGSQVLNADGSEANQTSLAYDNRNRLIETRLPHAENQDSITRLILDGEDNLTRLTDPNVHLDGWTFDDVDRMTSYTGSLDGESSVQYDTNDRVTRVTGPTGIVTEYTYDLLGRRLTEASPDRGYLSYRYDLADNIVAMTDGRGIETQYSYDALERITARTFSGSPGEDVVYEYDSCALGIGRLCGVGDESGQKGFAYDAWGNVVNREFTENSGQVYISAFGYDDGNHIISMTYPSGREIEFSRDGLRRINRIQTQIDGGYEIILDNIVYRGDDQMLQCSFGNGNTDSRSYDRQGRLTSQNLTTSGNIVLDIRNYSYDPGGNLLDIETNTEDNEYLYDPRDRVVSDLIDTVNDNLYDYDLNDNRLSRVRHQNNVYQDETTYQYQSNTNRLLVSDTITSELPENQEIINRRMVYNHAGRLFQLYEGENLTAEYIYNQAGQRTKKTIFQSNLPIETTIYHYDLNGLLISETDELGKNKKDYLWAESRQPVAQIEINTGGAEQVTYLHNDHLLTNRLGTDQTGKVIWRWEGEAFGSDLPDEDPDGDGNSTIVNLRFPGQYADSETGWYYNWNRYYDPGVGRYVTSDRIGLGGGSNTYTFVGGNPLSYIDILGLAFFGKRPVGSTPNWVAKSIGTNRIDDALNTELVHEQIFYEDGKYPSNQGFFGDKGNWNTVGTIRPDDPNRLKEYWRSDPIIYNDTLLREAVKNIGAGNYCLIGSNCQDWAEKIRHEYQRLKTERQKICL